MSETISDTQKAQLEDMLGVLAHIRLHPRIWIGSTDPKALMVFATGFAIAANLLGVDIEKGREAIWAERGWDTHRSATPVVEMGEKGWSQDAIISEVILMMMTNIMRRYNLTGRKILEMHDEIRQRIHDLRHDIDPEEAQQMESLERDLGITRNY
jgi:hypothetical protein